VLTHDPDNADIHYHLGTALLNANRLREALSEANDLLDLVGPERLALNLKLSCLIGLRREKQALRLATLYGNETDTLLTRARVANNFGRPEVALEVLEGLLALDPANAEALNFKGRALILMDRFGEALAVYDALLKRAPSNATFLYNRGVSLMNLGHPDVAKGVFHEVAEMPARPPYAIFNRGLVRLTLGEFPDALDDYEQRWRLPDQTVRRYVRAAIPHWTGQPLAGKRIVAFGEQGFGDILQFVRFVPLLKDLGAEVTLCVRTPLHDLLRTSMPDIPLVGEVAQDAQHGFDYQVSLFDVPRFLKTPLESVAQGPYLRTEDVRLPLWKDRVGQHGLRVAINWMGKPTYRANHLRSPPLTEFTPLFAVDGVRLISIQKVHGLDQLETLPDALPVETLDGLDEVGGAFMDTAAVMQAVDLVITSDTAVAHLAGGLGVPVWIALPFVADWRWMAGRPDTPWYPNARLYRQPAQGQWPPVFQAMARDLATL
jgi:Flp pilus assembly protein TadD